ncbi:transcription termination/antitermination NusG family protein [Candidatus Nitrospira bockiana]
MRNRENTDDAVKWFAISTERRYEKIVRDALASRGIDQVLPIIRRTCFWKGREKDLEVPLFPGFCFARLRQDEKTQVLQLPGVVGLVTADEGEDSTVDEELEALKRINHQCGRYELFVPGAGGLLVEAVRGPLQGIRGRLVRQAQEHLLVLALTLIGKAIAARIDPAHVKPVAMVKESA